MRPSQPEKQVRIAFVPLPCSLRPYTQRIHTCIPRPPSTCKLRARHSSTKRPAGVGRGGGAAEKPRKGRRCGKEEEETGGAGSRKLRAASCSPLHTAPHPRPAPPHKPPSATGNPAGALRREAAGAKLKFDPGRC
ncbi:Hypothetical predicted protein [Podarcis lilfordi]|uniref:Uncharacterized protein n=1 Tax=Podarcis lilfordi TaxID=74358 RepID=A0AA35KNS3_9SAUR|nr:Hypothetical predicted protein [Podarcis lilfordi]